MARDFVVRHAQSVHAEAWLFALAFAESSFFPIPPDVMLVVMLLAGSERFIYYSALTTVGSVMGGLFGYIIGAAFFELFGAPIVAFYGLESQVEQVAALFSTNAFWAIFMAAFTPIPYKVFTIAAGLFRIDVGVFILASFAGRGMRFFGEGLIMRLYGQRLGAIAYKYFNLFTLLVAIFGIVIALLLIY